MKKGKECLPLTILSASKEFKVSRPAFSLGIKYNNSLTVVITQTPFIISRREIFKIFA